ncbi:MAG TPA: GNAT family N-acetyltransferase [Aquificae bacterium]|nr:GNAT family N-acetyltransferase [Aquificota bacterium]
MFFLIFSQELSSKHLNILENYFQDSSFINISNYFKSYPTIFLFLFNIPLGFITYYKVLDEIHILNFVIKKNYQNKGYGKLLLKMFLYLYENKTFFLEVFKDNIKAINLYKKFNFKIIGERKNFYKNKDAYIMTLKRG